ncbi:hypothetical protein Glove_543g58 [Diversispora epigaea]|uniref:Uncharacterized protein n=1 Tax=Diversispora epigaea TaxID=1348612 RepID=A0A397GFV8_9GLOM|nr:hypothetical protein Glove_543g58 [Diversispora epigaea]
MESCKNNSHFYFETQNTNLSNYNNESDASSKLFNEEIYEFSESKSYEYSEENYIKALTALEKEATEQYSDKNEEDFETDSEIQEIFQEIPSIPLSFKENEHVIKLDSTLKTQFLPCILIDYIDNKLQSKGISLGVCMNHFNYDQKIINCGVECKTHLWQIWEKNIQILCIGFYTYFKEKTFNYGNIFDTTRGSSHTTLRMAFQIPMNINIKEQKIPNIVILETKEISRQWHTSKDTCNVLIILFSSYGVFNLAKKLSVKFLNKLNKVIDYRLTVRILELIWYTVAISIHIYTKKNNINMHNIMNSNSRANNILKIWYLYYHWASIFKAHCIGIRVGNYKLQKNALATLVNFFKHCSGSCAVSIKIDDDEKRKGHYFIFDKVLEMLKVKFIKQNITGNVIDVNNLKLQVKATQKRPTTKKLRQICCEIKPKEKRILKPLINCSVYPTIDQINQIKEILGNKWDKNRISQYISCHKKNKH